MTVRAPSTLRRRLEVTLVGVALVSVLLLSGVNYVFARQLVGDGLQAQLTSLRDTRVQAIERGAATVEAEVSTLGVTPSVVTALTELTEEFHELEDADLDDAVDTAALEQLYDDVLEPARDLGIDVSDVSLLPESSAGRYVQQQYIVDNPDDFDDRDRLVDAGDGSGYSEAHAAYHPLLQQLMLNAGMSDLLLVDAESGDVVYTTKKRVDIGANVARGVYADSQLGQVVDELSTVPVGQAVISDSAFYVPAHGEAVIFVAAEVRSGTEVIGAVVTELPVSALTDIVTAGGEWGVLGLGESGDVYVVGPDGTLRTDPRPWLDDPEAFRAEYGDETGSDEAVARMDILGSAALVVEVDNAAVEAAQRGEDFVGTVRNPIGDRTLAASGPVAVGDLDLVVVVEQDREESSDTLASLLGSMLLVAGVLLPVTALLGVVFARTLTRPFESLVAASSRIAQGEGDAEVADLGANELGDVGRQISAVADQLAAREQAILAEEQQITDVLHAVLPPRLVDRVRRGEQSIDDIVDTATVVSVTVGEIPEALGSDQDLVVDIVDHIDAELDQLMEIYRVDRVRRSTATALFLVGLDQPEACIDEAARFAAEVLRMITAAGAEFGQELTARAGIASGAVATGVIGHSVLSFGAWGDPVAIAVSLDAVARPGEILADGSVIEALSDEWEVGERESLPGLDVDLVAYEIALADPADTVSATDHPGSA